MGGWLKQSTAATILLGPFIDDTDGKTAETGLTISQGDVLLSKNGGAMAQKHDATSCTHDALGYYGCPLDTTDTGTLGILRVMVHEVGALPVWDEFMVVPEAVYNALFGTGMLPVNVEKWNAVDVPVAQSAGYPIAALQDGSITTGTFSEGAVNAAAIASNAITAAKIAGNAITDAKIATGAITAAKLAITVPELTPGSEPTDLLQVVRAVFSSIFRRREMDPSELRTYAQGAAGGETGVVARQDLSEDEGLQVMEEATWPS